MTENVRKKFSLNRAVFVKRPLESSALTVLCTLYHRFSDPGKYEVFINGSGRGAWRLFVQVEKGSAPNQISIDIATLDTRPHDCPGAEEPYLLNAGGIMAFFVSQGIERYVLQIRMMGEREKLSILDSRKSLPPGDLFSTTLVLPGVYRVVNEENGTEGALRVRLPDRNEKYRVDQVSLVESSREGFKPRETSILTGQSIAFLCTAPARLRVEPA
jgi:hypothetical protein